MCVLVGGQFYRLDKTKRALRTAKVINDEQAIKKLTSETKILTVSSYIILIGGVGVLLYIVIRLSTI